MADELKAKGNAAFSAGQYAEAIKWFSQAIEKDSGNHVLYSNRSASYASLQDYAKALEDAKQCVSLKPDWSKGYSRLGAAYFGLHEWDDARSAYEAGIRVDPANEQLKSGLEEVKKASAAPRSPFGSPEMLARLATDPRTRGFMAQPDFMAMISDLKANPSAATRYISDPRFQLALQVGLGLNFGGGGGADEREAYANDDDSGAAAAAAAPEAREPAAPKPPPPQQQQPAPAPESEPVEDDSEEGQRKRAAEEAKEAGNAAYKRRAFEDAIAHYNRALELYDGDIVYLINRAAVRVEMGDAEGAIADCDTAVERGRELRADFKLIAK